MVVTVLTDLLSTLSSLLWSRDRRAVETQALGVIAGRWSYCGHGRRLCLVNNAPVRLPDGALLLLTPVLRDA